MRIAVVTSTFPPYAGGIGNVAAFNAAELAKLGHEVEIFTPLYEKVDEEIESLKITRVAPLAKYGNAAFLPALGWMLKGFDIIHVHYPFFGGAETVWLYHKRFKKRGAKIVLHYHMDVVGQGSFKTIFSIHKKIMLPKIIKMADKVIVTSVDYAENSDIAKFMAKQPGKFSAVPNGVDTKRFQPVAKKKALLDKYGIGDSDKVALFVGGLDKAHYFKGVEYLIEACHRIGPALPWKLLIVGEGDLKQHYKSLAVQLRLDKQVIFPGYVPSAELADYYNLADVAVLPSVDKSEAFGLAMVEAMACGKAVVASDLAGVRSVIDENINGYLAEVKNIDDLAQKIAKLLSDAELAQRFGQAGRKKAEEKYGWEAIGNSLVNIYKSL